jgi:FkbM family methyltransferase
MQVQPVLLGQDPVKELGNYDATFLDKYFHEGLLDIGGAKFHDVRQDKDIMGTFWLIFDEIFYVYLNHGDIYLPKNYEPYGIEPYLMDGFMDMKIGPDDVVIDAGAWIGDFSAYCSVKGARVYAFEPSAYNYAWLTRTASVNKNIFTVPFGLAEKDKNVSLFQNHDWNSGMSFTYTEIVDDESPVVRVVSLDSFVEKEQLDRLDFIKCDIEGFERFMLEGARETIRRFKPKISMCTYHHPDDRQVLMAILLDIEPRYTIWFSATKMYCKVI